jgi:polyisoprenoid-binding protein YceI
MIRRTLGIFLSLGLLGAVLVSCAALSAPEEASAPIEAIPVATQAEVSENETGEEPQESEALSPPAAGTVTLQIVQDESEARFELDEILKGSPKHVVGTTNQVAGEILINIDDPSAVQVGTIQVNARTLSTDNSFRNRAIANSILETGTYEFITFTPTEIVGFPESPVLGETISFQIIGDLTVRDVTNEVVFDVTATPVSDSRLEASATATIMRGDYGLTIPSVAQVADVSEEVILTLDFVAVPVS